MENVWVRRDVSGDVFVNVPRDGWAYDFDRENNLVRITSLFFRENEIFLGNAPGYDGIPRSYRSDGANLLVNFGGETNDTEIRFVRK
jgi:hypothetical protein